MFTTLLRGRKEFVCVCVCVREREREREGGREIRFATPLWRIETV